MKSVVALSALTGAALLGWVLYYILGPRVDNWLQIRTSRDLETLRKHPAGRAGSVPLGTLVARKYTVESWHAYHEDWIFATRVDCSASDPSGRALDLSWEVRHGNPPRDWVPERDLYITPLTREAARLAPALLPAGVLPEDLPVTRYGSGVVYDIAHDRLPK